MHQIEPFFGWLHHYQNEGDPLSPFYETEHDTFSLDRGVYEYLAHPEWEEIGSDSLLLKILYTDYEKGYSIVEMFGVWNDLIQNDYRLLSENFLELMLTNGITKYILIMENVLNMYLDSDDYYEAMQEQLGDGWICMLRPRLHVVEEIEEYQIGKYFYWAPDLDALAWRKLKPWELFAAVAKKMQMLLP